MGTVAVLIAVVIFTETVIRATSVTIIVSIHIIRVLIVFNC